MATAPFPARIDTTMPGTLIGPFDGRAVDAQSRRPIRGAVVWVSWRFCRAAGLSARLDASMRTSVCLPAGNEVWSGETDADGHYSVPQLKRFPGAVRLEGVTLVVYKHGYLGYRSDRYFEGALQRHDFAQSRNEARLDRYPEGTSHAEHLAFLGGAAALRAAARAEALQISVDTASGAEITGPLEAAALLSVDELRTATGASDAYAVDRLPDRPRTARYDSVHFKSSSRGEEADAALRVFLAESEEEAEKLFDEIIAELPRAQALDPVPSGLGARASLARDGEGDHGLLGLALLDRTDRAVLLVTCGAALCKSAPLIEAIARRAVTRLSRVGRGPLPADAPGTVLPKAAEDGEAPLKLREPGLHR